MSWIGTGVAVVGSLLGSSAAAKKAAAEAKAGARKAGKNRAQLEAAFSRTKALLPGKTREINETALLQDVQTQKDGAAAVAEATVMAAAAGVEGANVEQTKQAIEGNAATVEREIEKQRRSGLLQVNQDYEDLWWEAENQKFGVELSGKTNVGRNVASAALSGIGSYYGA